MHNNTLCDLDVKYTWLIIFPVKNASKEESRSTGLVEKQKLSC